MDCQLDHTGRRLAQQSSCQTLWLEQLGKVVGMGRSCHGHLDNQEITMDHAKKIQLLALVNHIVAVGGLWYAFSNSAWIWIGTALAACVFVAIVSVNIGLHRYVSHRSFETGPKRKKFLLYSSVAQISWRNG